MPLLALCYIIWGGDTIAMKFALESFSPVQIIFSRVLVPAVLYLFLLPKWFKWHISARDLGILCLLTICEPCLFFLAVTNALRFCSASEAGAIAGLFPIFVAIGSCIVFKTRLYPALIIAALLAASGIAFMSWNSQPGEAPPFPGLGMALMLAGMLFSASFVLCAKYLSSHFSALFISAFQAIGATLVFLPFFLLQPLPKAPTASSVAGLAYLSIGIGVCVYLCYNWIIRKVTAPIAGIFGCLSPMSSIFFAWLILNERLSGWQYAGICIALSGLLVIGISQFGNPEIVDKKRIK